MLAAGPAAGLVAAGLLGWLGGAADLVSLPCAVAAAAAGAALAGFTTSAAGGAVARLALALGATGLAAVALPFGVTRLLGAVLLGPACATLLVGAPRDDQPSGRSDSAGR
ncbi:MAG: hypothetical protein U0807_13555 [Candidatus Binatia bacterium]